MFYHRKLPRVLLAMSVLPVFLGTTVFTETFFTDVGIVHADTPGFGPDISYVNFNLTNSASLSLRSRYDQMLRNLRNAAGHPYRQSVAITQSNEHGLVFLNVNLPNHTDVSLIFTASNLYFRGFMNTDGQIFSFNDYDLGGTLAQRFNTPLTEAHTLRFSSQYNSLENAAHLERHDIPISYQSIRDALNVLANANPPGNGQEIAQATLLLITWTSEAARFYEIQDVMQNAMAGASSHRLTTWQRELETSWDSISAFGQAITRNFTTPPSDIHGVGTFRSFNDVMRQAAILNYSSR
ncbi:MAG: ribosome-inactivating family protein [Nostoc sp.]